MFMYCAKKAGRNHEINITNKFLEKAANTKYLKTAPTNANRRYENIRSG